MVNKYFNIMIVWFICGLLADPGSTLTAQNEVFLKIESGAFKPINLYIVPFQSETQDKIAESFRQVIINDLTLSGFFRIYPGKTGENGDNNGNLTSTPVDNGALIEGNLAFDKSSISLVIKLSDWPGKHLIFNKKFKGLPGVMRQIAHTVSDEIVYYLVGEPGIASTQIAFITSKNSVTKEINLIDYDGYGIKQLTFTNSLNVSPRWAPDGEKIAFTSYAMGNPDLLSVQRSDGKISRITNYRGLNTAPAWSPDGKKLAVTLTKDGNPEIYVMDVTGNKIRRLTNHPGIDSSPSWSPDGREIAYTSDRSGNPQVYLIDAEGGNTRRLTFWGNYNDSPAWSPKGDRIAFVSRDERQFHIYTIDVTGENLQKITDGPGNNENPSWAPDGLKLAFASNRDGQWDIYVINWVGSQLRRLTKNGGNVSPSWSPRLKIKE